MPRKKKEEQDDEQKKTLRRSRGEGSVSQREDGRWMVRIPIGGGKRKTEYFDTKAEAERGRRRMLNERETGTLVTSRDQTLEAYLMYWLEAHRMTVRKTTYVMHRGHLMSRVIPELGKIMLRKLTVEMFQALYQKWEKELLSPYTIILIHNIVRQALEDAVKWKKLAYNPVQHVKLPKVSKPEIPVLTTEEIDRLLKYARETTLYALFRMALLLGMRMGELLGLKWSDIDFEGATLRIERTVSYIKDPETERCHFLVGPPKTRAGKRTIPLPQDIIEVLQSHREQQVTIQRMATRWESLDLVFCTRNGNYLEAGHVRDVFNRLLNNAGLKHMKFHALRHNANAILRRMKIDAVVRKRILGHEKIDMTDDVYGHATQEDLREAAQQLDRFFHHPEGE